MWTRAGVGILGLVLLSILLYLALPPTGPQARPAGPAQPIAFSHRIHAGQYQIDCQYCHSEARRSEYAGIPSVTRCMGCHKITAADRPEIKRLAEYFGKQEPVPWVRIYKVPEYVYFPHKPHVRAGLTCQTCHGPVQTMDVVAAATGWSLANDLLNLVNPAAKPPPLTMGWCVECHASMNAARKTRAPMDCFACHH